MGLLWRPLHKEKMALFGQILKSLDTAYPLCLYVSQMSYILDTLSQCFVTLLKQKSLCFFSLAFAFDGNTSLFDWLLLLTEKICFFFLSWTWRISILFIFIAQCILHAYILGNHVQYYTLINKIIIIIIIIFVSNPEMLIYFTWVSIFEQSFSSLHWNI